jgi:predicted Fe-Mo cluster-binding NifX family protein
MVSVAEPTVVCVPVDAAGAVDRRWGRAHTVAVASMADGAVRDWVEHVVAWDELHDQGAEGLHHARVARFLQEHAVTDVVAAHMGVGMEHMLARMGIAVHFGAAGDARAAVATALAAPRRPML